MSRLPPLLPEHMNEAQAALYAALTAGPRTQGRLTGSLTDAQGALRGPFNALLYSPRVGNGVQALGEDLRFHGNLSARIRELAILQTAVHWRSGYEWFAHAAIAKKAGWDEQSLDKIRRGEDPEPEDDTERMVFHFVAELLRDKTVSEATYAHTVDALGEAETAELVVLLGYYAMISMVLNVFDVRLPDGHPPVAWT